MTKVKVCDALCGSGKTSAAINMMNKATDNRFIFVTQFLSETERIQKACPEKNFILPCDNIKEGLTKLKNTQELLSSGANVATTHSLFVSFTDEIKDLIVEQKYILILDEVVDVMQACFISKNDLNILTKSQSIVEHNDCIEWCNDEYDQYGEGRFYEEMLKARSHNFLRYDDQYFFWTIPPELFGCFEDVYVLTYMFKAQFLRCFFDAHNIEYELIGTHQVNNQYEFCSIDDMDRTRELRDKIHILDHKKANSIGNKRTALSFSWYRKFSKQSVSGDLLALSKHLRNVFRNVYGACSSDWMWTTFREYRKALSTGGFVNSFVVYNKRASNEYADRHYLAYCVNNFPRPIEQKYFFDRGVEFNGDMYALSILVQWIFRSAIRNGEEVYVYIPSARMRSLLAQWLDNLAEGKDLEPIKYTTPRKNYCVPKS